MTGNSVEINISDIKYDEEYKFSNTFFSDELYNSIKNYGILKSLIVVEKNDSYRIISGHNRYKVAREIGLDFIPAVINSLNHYDFFKEVLLKSYQNEVNSISKIRFICKFFESNKKESKIFSALKVPEKYKSKINIDAILGIDNVILNYIDEKNLNFKIIEEITNLNDKSLLYLKSVVNIKNIKSNIVKEVIYLLSELQRKNKTPEFSLPDEKNTRIIENCILNQLKEINFSKYYAAVNRIEAILEKYKKEGFSIVLPENFEGNSIELKMKIKNEKDLALLKSNLESISIEDVKQIIEMM